MRAYPAALALCLLCVACTSPDPRPAPGGLPIPTVSPSPAAATDPTLRWAIGEPTAIVPIDATTPDDLLVVDALFDSLTAWNDVLDVRPAVASSWNRADGGATWRFSLRADARFHDGTRVTANHFVRTWNELARRGRAHHHLQDVAGYRGVRRGRSTSLHGVAALDASTLEIRLSRPLAEFPAVVAHPALAPMAAPAVSAAQRDRPIGNGPFRMAEPWAHDRFVRLERVGTVAPVDATGATPLHEVVFQIQDPASAYIAYEQGGVDVATVPPIALAADPAPAEPTTRYRGPGLLQGDLPSTYFLLCNTTQPPCATVHARRGIALAVDRRRVVAEAFHRSAAPGLGVLPAALPGQVNRTCGHCVHDPVGARHLLQRGGVERTRLWISRGGDHRRVARRIQADLAHVGVAIRIKAVGFDRFLSALRSGERGLFRFGWTLDYPTGDNALRPLFHSRGGLNYARYRHRDVDALLDAAATAQNPRRRLALYREAEDLILGRDQAVIPVASLRRRTVVADRVDNLVYGPMGTANLEQVRIVEGGP